jgi:hypothetical protein
MGWIQTNEGTEWVADKVIPNLDDYRNSLAEKAAPNGWTPDVGDWFNGAYQPYDAALNGKVGAPVDRNRFNDFLDAHQINSSERDDYYNNYLDKFNTAQAEQEQYQADPKNYINQKAQEYADAGFTDFIHNGQGFGVANLHAQEKLAALEALKNVDPNAYYNAQLGLDLKKAGWDAGQGKTNDVTNSRIQNNIQGALKSGFDPNQIQSLVANNYANTASWHANNIAQSAGQGAFLQGIEKVAPAFAAMLTAGALAPAAGALEAGAVGSEVAAGSLYGGTGFGAGSTGLVDAAGNIIGAGTQGLAYGTGAEAIPFELPDGTMGSIQNGNIVDASGNIVAKGGTGLNFGETLRTANQLRQGIGAVNTLSKLAGGGATGSAVGGATPTASGANATSGLSPQQLAKYLYSAAPAQTNSFIGQIKANQNPFTFNVPNQTTASQGMYDVSGVNPMANALRKNNGTNS